MAEVDPYAPCPCGSGQKFKWCCQKVEVFATKAERLQAGGQLELALQALDEGLRKHPDNAWLLVRKALALVQGERSAEARPVLERIVQAQPAHAGAHALLTRVLLETEGPAPAAAQLQRGLAAVPREQWPPLAYMAQLVGTLLGRIGDFPPAIKHLELAEAILPDDRMLASSVEMIERDPTVAPWLKDRDAPSPPPADLDEPALGRFRAALEQAEAGLWARAATAFEALTAEGIAGADRNLGFCKLWMVDEAGAVAALRRHVARLGETEEAVDIEALCQLVALAGPDDLVEHVQLIWPLRDREALLATLKGRKDVLDEGRAPIDPNDPESFEVDELALLDRPVAPSGTTGHVGEIPRIVGRVLVGHEIAVLDAHDDGRLDALTDRFRELAGATIPPAHPKTKVVGKVARADLALQSEWVPPEGIDEATSRRLNLEEQRRIVQEIWPKTPMPFLNGRTPEQAAAAGDARVPLRAALRILEFGGGRPLEPDLLGPVRQRLGVAPEPEVDPETVDIARLHLSRLDRVPADRLDDDRLVALYQRAREASIIGAMERAANELVRRPTLLARGDVERFAVYADLANLAMVRGDTEAAFEWVRRGRRDEPGADRPRNASRWDLLEVRLRARSEGPESWVPHLAAAIERFSEDETHREVLFSSLMEMGLIQFLPDPDRRGRLLLDSRALQALLAEYGPRVTTASGTLGVSATKGDIWTPGGPSGAGGGAIWTPGSGAPPAATPGEGEGDKPRLIIPGR
ncbi:MAG TPA: hypothetical protein VG406_03545 [Isosphaeraceae bacterium]|jgi:tetratricopeptide (TPR) repeat protein|nr:hypothetical protein [Isosphaeraceae bacterium]